MVSGGVNAGGRGRIHEFAGLSLYILCIYSYNGYVRKDYDEKVVSLRNIRL